MRQAITKFGQSSSEIFNTFYHPFLKSSIPSLNRIDEEITRGFCHKNGVTHSSMHLYFVSSSQSLPDRQLLFQKRSFRKDTFARYWDISCAGHLDYGCDEWETVLRECEEELGARLKYPAGALPLSESDNPVPTLVSDSVPFAPVFRHENDASLTRDVQSRAAAFVALQAVDNFKQPLSEVLNHASTQSVTQKSLLPRFVVQEEPLTPGADIPRLSLVPAVSTPPLPAYRCLDFSTGGQGRRDFELQSVYFFEVDLDQSSAALNKLSEKLPKDISISNKPGVRELDILTACLAARAEPGEVESLGWLPVNEAMSTWHTINRLTAQVDRGAMSAQDYEDRLRAISRQPLRFTSRAEVKDATGGAPAETEGGELMVPRFPLYAAAAEALLC